MVAQLITQNRDVTKMDTNRMTGGLRAGLKHRKVG